MGTIAEKLSYLDETREQILTNIQALGGDLTEESTFRSYADALDEVWEEQDHVTGTGTELSLNTKKGKMKVELSPSELEQETTSISEGDEYDSPSPEHPQEIHTVSGDNTVVVGNKNLFDKDNVIYVNNKILNDNGVEVSDSTGGYTKMYIPVKPDTEYTISGLSSTGSKRIYFFDNSKTFISRSVNSTLDTRTFTTPSNCEYIDIQYYINSNDFNTYQLELGSTATSYVPHQEQTYPLSLGDLEYCKIGDYEDEFRKSTGKNLFDEDNTTIQNALLSDDGYYSSNNTNKSFIFECEGNTTYTISKVASTRFRVAEFESLPTIGSLYSNRIKNDTDTSITYTTSNNAKYLVVSFYNTSDTLSEQAILNTVQIEKGSTATELEPYGKQWYLKKNIGKVVLDGSESWDISGTEPYYRHRYITDFVYKGDIPQLNLSNYFINASVSSSNTTLGFFVVNTGELRIREQNMKSVANWKSWLSNNNLILYKVLSTPTYTLLNDTLQAQLEAIWRANSYEEQTNISQENNDLPFVINAKALGIETEVGTLSLNSLNTMSLNPRLDTETVEPTIEEQEESVEEEEQ